MNRRQSSGDVRPSVPHMRSFYKRRVRRMANLPRGVGMVEKIGALKVAWLESTSEEEELQEDAVLVTAEEEEDNIKIGV